MRAGMLPFPQASAPTGGSVRFDAASGRFVSVNEFADALFRLTGSADKTKRVAFEVDGLTSNTVRTLTVPDASGTLPLLSLAQTWTGTNRFDAAEGLTLGAAATAGAGRIQVAAGTTVANALNFGGDTPVYRLGAGVLALPVTLYTGHSASTADCAIELGGLRTADGNAYIDWHTTSGSDYELRILRGSGANGGATINHKGTGTFSLTCEGAAELSLATSNTTRFRIGPAGDFHLRGGTPATPSAFAAWTGTATRSSIATGSATVANCAEAIKALIDDLKTIGVLP